MSQLIQIITARDVDTRNRSLDAVCRELSPEALLQECAALDQFRRASDNLYERVRALFFLYAIHRFHLSQRPGAASKGTIPFSGYTNLLKRRFEEAIDLFLAAQSASGPSQALSSALAAGYRSLGFQTLADQVRRSVRSVRGNQWMFRAAHPEDAPLRIRPELLQRGAARAGSPPDLGGALSDGAKGVVTSGADGLFPILHEATPVRMDLSHSGWSDIFFLGMDYPEGARVLNVSIDLSVNRSVAPKPPVEAWFRVIDQPVLRLVSIDLQASAEITSLPEVFDFARDYLGLLKAAVIAAFEHHPRSPQRTPLLIQGGELSWHSHCRAVSDRRSGIDASTAPRLIEEGLSVSQRRGVVTGSTRSVDHRRCGPRFFTWILPNFTFDVDTLTGFFESLRGLPVPRTSDAPAANKQLDAKWTLVFTGMKKPLIRRVATVNALLTLSS